MSSGPGQRIRVCFQHHEPMVGYQCPVCGSANYVHAYLEPAEVEEEPEQKIHPLSGPLHRATFSGVPFHLPPGSVSGWHGRPGSGKSSLALMSLPQADGAINEMAEELWWQYRARLAQRVPELAHRPRYLIPVHADHDMPEHGVRTGHLIGFSHNGMRVELGTIRELIVDSVSMMPDPLQSVQWLVNRAEEYDWRVIALIWASGDGEVRGGNGMTHPLAQHLEVCANLLGQRQVVIHKNRLGGTGVVVFDLPGEPRAQVTSYVSVEGVRPSYTLRPWPSYTGWSGIGDAEYADVLKHAEKNSKTGKKDEEGFHLPPPPIAVAASRSALYKSGWTEPGDWKARAAFAIESGAPYYSPVYGRIFAALEDLNLVEG